MKMPKPCMNVHNLSTRMSSVAAKARSIVDWAASPHQLGDTPQKQIKRAAEKLGLHRSDTDFNKVWRAFYGKAKKPTLVDIEERANQHLEYRLHSLIEAMNEADPDVYQPRIKALRKLLELDDREVRLPGLVD